MKTKSIAEGRRVIAGASLAPPVRQMNVLLRRSMARLCPGARFC
jgi:hypothetical protein